MLEEPHLDHYGVVSAPHHCCSQLNEVFVSLPLAVLAPSGATDALFLWCCDLRVMQSVLGSVCDEGCGRRDLDRKVFLAVIM